MLGPCNVSYSLLLHIIALLVTNDDEIRYGFEPWVRTWRAKSMHAKKGFMIHKKIEFISEF